MAGQNRGRQDVSSQAWSLRQDHRKRREKEEKGEDAMGLMNLENMALKAGQLE